jgi:hypothetical protein
MLKRFLDSPRGQEAVEFALVLPAMIGLTIGVMEMLLLLFANSSLHYAVDEAARCMSVDSLSCPTTTATEAYGRNRYYGPDITPTFTAVNGRCGDAALGPKGAVVSATGHWRINGVIFHFDVPLSATACFPSQNP